MTPNPTEEQTSPRTFEEWITRPENWSNNALDLIDAWNAAENARQPEIDRLRTALRKYGRHLPGCSLDSEGRSPVRESDWHCTCGFEALDG